MTKQRGLLSLSLIFIPIIFYLLFFFSINLFTDQQIINYAFHSTIEAVGGIFALIIAGFLFTQTKAEKYQNRYFFLIVGFLCTGTLDLLHSNVLRLNLFVQLRSLSSLAGSLWFVMVWLPDKWINKFTLLRKKYIFTAAIGSIGLCILLLLIEIPLFINHYNVKFTDLSVNINFISAILYFIAGVWFLRYYRTGEIEPALFTGMFFLFGTAGLLFPYSHIWNVSWWTWHILRFSAYFFAFVYIVKKYHHLLADLKLAHRKLQQEEEKYRTLVDNALVGIYQTTLKGEILFVNKYWAEILGFETTEEFIQSGILTRYKNPADRARLIERLKSTGKINNFELEVLTKTGEIKNVLVNAILKDEVISGMVVDITERVKATAALKKIEWLLNPKIEHPPVYEPVYGDLTQLNTSPTILDIVGKKELSEIVNELMDILGTSSAVYEKNGDYALGVFSSGWCQFMDRVSYLQCGTTNPRDALTSGKWLCHEACWNKASRISIETDNPVDIECDGGIHLYAVPIKTSREVIGSINIGYGSPPRDLDNLTQLAEKYNVKVDELVELTAKYEDRPPFVIEIAKNRLTAAAKRIGLIVERKQAELEKTKMEQQMIQTQKLESLGVLAGGIAHDFNNILVSIMGYADLVLHDLPPLSTVRDDIQEILKASRQASDLCKQMLAYSGKGQFVLKTFSLSQLVEEILHLLKTVISKRILLNINLEKNLFPIYGDIAQIKQMLMNLVINAAESIGDHSGVVTISTGAMDCTREYLSQTFIDENLKEGTYIWLEVSDTGCGMDKEMQTRIFEPFFTTKFTGRGLGLSAVLGIIRGHKGAIKVYSEVGKGTTFKIMYPAVIDETYINDKMEVDKFASWHPTGTVLLVDDEETVRSIGKRLLEKIGFTVITAADGIETMNVYTKKHSEIQVVILDLTMPHMNGEETFRSLHRQNPDVKVLLSSGYNSTEIISRFAGKGLAGFIQKPYTLLDLKDKLYEIISKK